MASLRAAGIPTAIYYPLPLNRQEAYRQFPVAPEGVPVSEHLASQVLSFPMHPYLEVEIPGRVTQTLRNAILAR